MPAPVSPSRLVTVQEQLRALPSVDEVLSSLEHLAAGFPRSLIVSEIRRTLEQARSEIRSGHARADKIESRVEQSLRALQAPSLRPVINATGVILHTNLGRSPLGPLRPIPGYSNLEFDIATGRRGKRDVHAAALLERLLGKPAIVVNNNAAAVYVALHELAGGFEVIVSRGELIEIGDGFRIPEIMARSGAILREVGTTNRTHIRDYREAITDRTRLILRVHPSNFRIQGFTSRPSLEELAALSRESGIPVYEDLGSGCVMELKQFGIEEPLVPASLHAGMNLVSFSGDKLLGGPQAGILAGDAHLIARLRKNPMYRALRVDKLIYQALEGVLRNLLFEKWDDIPGLRMLRMSASEIKARAERVLVGLAGLQAELIQGESVIGGGSTPGESLPTWLVAVFSDDVAAFESRLRAGDPPVIARIEQDRLLLDLRTVFEEEEESLAAALNAAAKA